MKKFGLLGRNIEYSLSPSIHNAWYKKNNIDAHFELINLAELTDDDMRRIARQYDGICVTTPYKKKVFDMVDRIFLDCMYDAASFSIGVSNVVSFSKPQVCLRNTDVNALVEYLVPYKTPTNWALKKALILGGGGAAFASLYALCYDGVKIQRSNVDMCFLERNPDKTSRYILTYEDYIKNPFPVDVVINATPMGASRGGSGVDASLLESILNIIPTSDLVVVVDWVYDAEPTLLSRFATQNSIPCIDGKSLLKRQAELAFFGWFDFYP